MGADGSMLWKGYTVMLSPDVSSSGLAARVVAAADTDDGPAGRAAQHGGAVLEDGGPAGRPGHCDALQCPERLQWLQSGTESDGSLARTETVTVSLV